MLSASENEIIVWDISKKTIAQIISLKGKEIYLMDDGFYIREFERNCMGIYDLSEKKIGMLEKINFRQKLGNFFDSFYKIGFYCYKNIYIWETNQSKDYTVSMNEICNAEISAIVIRNSQLSTLIGKNFCHFCT